MIQQVFRVLVLLLCCRALALKQVSNRDVLRVCLKEAGAGCMMGEQQPAAHLQDSICSTYPAKTAD
jgi:Mg/Co/Ni transporter MgtE